jgi:hypothetical protein
MRLVVHLTGCCRTAVGFVWRVEGTILAGAKTCDIHRIAAG